MGIRRGAAAWLAWLTLALPLTALAAGLPQSIANVLQAHKVPESAVSIVVRAADEDVPRLALNVDEPRNPASTVKLVTTWAALDMLGPTHTWPTRVYAMGPLVDGVLDGDLLIKGYGDPFLVIEDLWKMLGELRRKGVREITGDLVIDGSHFDLDESDAGAFDGERFRLYNVLPHALMVNFQSIEFTLDPEPASGRIVITSNPVLPNLTITNRVRMTTGACRGRATKLFMDFGAPDDPDHVVFSGEMPGSCRNYTLARTAMSAESYAYGAFRSLWEQWGGTLAGGVRSEALTVKQRPLVTWRSRTLAEIIRPLNKWSNNLMTRMLLYSLAETRSGPPLTRAAGAEAVREHLAGRGLDTTSLVIDNGSGLSRNTRLTARFMSEMLGLAWFDRSMPEYVASLAIAGKDGTMRKRFRGRRENGWMHLKTGSLDKVSAIAGYVHTPQGRTFIVVMLANHARVNYGVGKNLQDAVLQWAFGQN
ncbi:MAG: D-alanyl-D-alanine carboxypeptidase/D-alanyl-D-alanine endopeptidase [Gammaproteobacteria bacterium]